MGRHCKFWPALIFPSSALITSYLGISAFPPLPVAKCSNKLAPNVPNTKLRNPLFSFASFLTVLLTLCTNKSDYSRGLTFFMISSNFLFEMINDIPDPIIFLCIPTSAADAASVNSNGI